MMKPNRHPVALLWLLVALLLGGGMMMVYSVSQANFRDSHGDQYYLLKRQFIWASAGLLVFFLAYHLDYHWWRRRPLLLLGLGLVSLMLVFVPGVGRSGGGAQRWVGLGNLAFQPSELAKYILIIYLADLLSRRQEKLDDFREVFLPALAVIGVFSALVVVQPDLGSALGILVAGLLMLFVAGARISHLLLLGLAALPAAAGLILKAGYRRQRILSFLDPGADPQGAGFQIIQSFIALGSGGWSGVGLGVSRQKLFYLPAATTDFIFSILGEELGFMGTISVLLLFLGVLVCGFVIARSASDLYGQLLALGITSMLSLQAFVNMGVVCGLLPTKGLPLPFVSYGGSNLVVSLLAVGILSNIASHRQEECFCRTRKHSADEFKRIEPIFNPGRSK